MKCLRKNEEKKETYGNNKFSYIESFIIENKFSFVHTDRNRLFDMLGKSFKRILPTGNRI